MDTLGLLPAIVANAARVIATCPNANPASPSRRLTAVPRSLPAVSSGLQLGDYASVGILWNSAISQAFVMEIPHAL